MFCGVGVNFIPFLSVVVVVVVDCAHLGCIVSVLHSFLFDHILFIILEIVLKFVNLFRCFFSFFVLLQNWSTRIWLLCYQFKRFFFPVAMLKYFIVVSQWCNQFCCCCCCWYITFLLWFVFSFDCNKRGDRTCNKWMFDHKKCPWKWWWGLNVDWRE